MSFTHRSGYRNKTYDNRFFTVFRNETANEVCRVFYAEIAVGDKCIGDA